MVDGRIWLISASIHLQVVGCLGRHFTRPGKHTTNYVKSPFLMVKTPISTGPFSIAMFVYLAG